MYGSSRVHRTTAAWACALCAFFRSAAGLALVLTACPDWPAVLRQHRHDPLRIEWSNLTHGRRCPLEAGDVADLDMPLLRRQGEDTVDVVEHVRVRNHQRQRPFSVNSFAAQPPEIPDPTTMASQL
jgi:hypothetical protein